MERWRRYRHPHIYRESVSVTRQPRRFLWRPSRRVFLATLIALGVVAGVWLITASSVFAINQIQLAGEVTPAVNERLQQLQGKNIFLLREDRIFQDALVADPALASLRIARGFPQRLQITTARRHPALLWQVGEQTWAIDQAGVVFPVDPSTANGVTKVIDKRALPVTPGEQVLAPGFVQFTLAAVGQTQSAISGRILHAEVDETTFHLRLVTEWGWAILLDTNRSALTQADQLQLILAEHRDKIHDYVDLRIPGWAYIL